MKLRYVLLLLAQLSVLSLAAMSADERATFKKQLMQTQTSQEMEQLVKEKLLEGTRIRLEFSRTSMLFIIYSPPASGDSPQIEHEVCKVLEELFFTEMHPFIFGTASKADALATIARYQWAREYVCSPHRTLTTNIQKDFDSIFDVHSCQKVTTDVGIKYNYARRKCAQYTKEDRLWGGKELLSRRVFGYTHAAWGARISYVMLPLVFAATAATAYRYMMS